MVAGGVFDVEAENFYAAAFDEGLFEELDFVVRWVVAVFSQAQRGVEGVELRG